MKTKEKKYYYNYKSAIIAILINIAALIFIPCITKYSSTKNFKKIFIKTRKVKVYTKKKIKKNFKYKKIIKKKLPEPIKKIKKIKLKRIAKKIQLKKMDLPQKQLVFKNKLYHTPKIKNVPVIKTPKIDLPQSIKSNLKKETIINSNISETSNIDFNRVFDETELDKNPKLKFKIKPIYPYLAKKMGIEGFVTIEFLITSSGKVKNVKILNFSPSKIFNKSVLNAVKKWKFLPGTIKNTPVNCLCKVKLKFDLTEE